MTKIASMRKWILAFVLLCPSLLYAQCAGVTSCTAASNSQTDVQTALNSINLTNTVLTIPTTPSSSVTWSTGVALTTTLSITIQGCGTIATSDAHGNPVTYNDCLTITDAGSAAPLFHFTTNSGGSTQLIRITGITIHDGGDASWLLSLGGGPGNIRVDHNHFVATGNGAIARIYSYGVADHNLVVSPVASTHNGFQIFSNDNSGNASWHAASQFGSANFFFIENNTFTEGFANDCNVGGRYVGRYNTLTVSNGNNGASFQEHATGAVQTPPWRGCRAWEVYNNWMTSAGGAQSFSASQEFSATGLQHGNTVTNFVQDVRLVNDRDQKQTNYTQVPPPNGWGYCGTLYSGVSSAWDGNFNNGGSNGSPCLDQPGRGQGDILQGNFPTVCDASTTDCTNSIYTGRWPSQYLEPVYVWGETLSSVGSVVTADNYENNMLQNRDWYTDVGASCTAGGTCTSGIGTGLSTNKPTTCTAGLGGTYYTSPTGSYGVGFWATDNSTLYVCTSANTWTAVYTPYTYPHPLVSGNPQASTPVCSPGTGTYSSPQSVTCTNPSSAPVLCQTQNGSTPATNGATGCSNGSVVSGTISVSSSITLKVVAGGTGFSDSSPSSGAYTISTPAPPAYPAIFTGNLKVSGNVGMR